MNCRYSSLRPNEQRIFAYGSLIEHEILLADLHRTKKQLALDREEEGDVGSYIIIELLERFKVETVEWYHLTPVAK